MEMRFPAGGGDQGQGEDVTIEAGKLKASLIRQHLNPDLRETKILATACAKAPRQRLA